MNISDYLQLLLDGAEVFLSAAPFFLLITIEIIGLGVLTSALLYRSNKTIDEYSLLVVFTAGMCSFTLLAVGFVTSRTLLTIFPMVLYTISFFVGLFFIAKWAIHAWRNINAIGAQILPMGLSILVVIFARSAFLKDLEFPLFHDSASHYQIIVDLIALNENSISYEPESNLILGRYYHIGYHSLVASVQVVLGSMIPLAKTMLLIGQYFIFVLIFSLFFLVARISRSNLAGYLSVIYAGLGWSMPAYAANWGKYPALISLVFICFVAIWGTAYFSTSDKPCYPYGFLAFLCALTGFLIHSRSVIVLICFVCAGILYYFVVRMSRNTVACTLVGGIASFVVLLLVNEQLSEALMPYVEGSYLFISTFSLLIAILGLYHNPKLTLVVFAFVIFLALVSLFRTPAVLTNFFGEYFFDRPFLQLVLFAPFSIMAAGGGWYLEKRIRSGFLIGSGIKVLIISVALFLLTGLFVLSKPIEDFYPNDCCIYVHHYDQIAIEWISKNISEGRRVVIARIEEPTLYIPTDAGMWITPLTGVKTSRIRFDEDLTNPRVMSDLCQNDNQFIYVSMVDQSFFLSHIEAIPEFYLPEVILPGVHIYSLNCTSEFPQP